MKGFLVSGHMATTASFSLLDALRWWLIKLLAGRRLSVMVNIKGDGKGFIWLGKPYPWVGARIEGVRFIADIDTLHDLYDNNPEAVREEW